jgi:hypothetical protein
MKEVILDKNDTAATALVNFQTVPGIDGDFFCSPYYIDNLCHLSGFIVNASDVESESPLVYISHGWESLKFLRPSELSPEKTYRSFVRMIPQPKNVSAGDVYILDVETEQIVAVLYGSYNPFKDIYGIRTHFNRVEIPGDTAEAYGCAFTCYP